MSRAAWSRALTGRLAERARGGLSFDELWTGDLLKALQHLAGFLPVQVWIQDEALMKSYRKTGALPALAPAWLPAGLDPNELTLRDFEALGRDLRRKWSSLGWDAKFGALNGHLALSVEAAGLHKGAAHFKATRRRVDALTRGTRGERLLALWGFAVLNASHLRVFGMHPEPNEKGEPELLDNAEQLAAVREFLTLLAEAEGAGSWPGLLPPQEGFRGKPAAAAFKDFMLWGLVVMLEPLIHNYRLARAPKKDDEYVVIDPAEFGEARWPGGPSQQMREAFAAMTDGLKVPKARVEDILRQALSRRWSRLGLTSPLTFAVDRAALVVPRLNGLGPLPTRELPLNLAVEAVFKKLSAPARAKARVADFSFAYRRGSPIHHIRKTKPGLRHYIDAAKPAFPALAREFFKVKT